MEKVNIEKNVGDIEGVCAIISAVCGDTRGYGVDGVTLNLSNKDPKWLGLRETFKF